TVSAMRIDLDRFLSVARIEKLPAADVYAQVLAWKGAVTLRQEDQRRLRLALVESGHDKVLQEKLARLRNDVRGLERLNFHPPASDPQRRIEDQRTLESLAASRDEVEAELARRVKRSGQDRRSVTPRVDDLRAALASTALNIALVDFLEYHDLNPP